MSLQPPGHLLASVAMAVILALRSSPASAQEPPAPPIPIFPAVQLNLKLPTVEGNAIEFYTSTPERSDHLGATPTVAERGPDGRFSIRIACAFSSHGTLVISSAAGPRAHPQIRIPIDCTPPSSANRSGPRLQASVEEELTPAPAREVGVLSAATQVTNGAVRSNCQIADAATSGIGSSVLTYSYSAGQTCYSEQIEGSSCCSGDEETCQAIGHPGSGCFPLDVELEYCQPFNFTDGLALVTSRMISNTSSPGVTCQSESNFSTRLSATWQFASVPQDKRVEVVEVVASPAHGIQPCTGSA
jgi:hypothetical protein